MTKNMSIVMIAVIAAVMVAGALAVTVTTPAFAANNGVHNGNGPDPCANTPNPNAHRTTEHNPHCI